MKKNINLLRSLGVMAVVASALTVISGCNPNRSSETTTTSTETSKGNTAGQPAGSTGSTTQQPGTAPSPGVVSEPMGGTGSQSQ